jgi:hypothetical protein
MGYDVVSMLLDIAIERGPVNYGNNFSANGANLYVDKSLGTTTGVGFNFQGDPQSPAKRPDAARTQTPLLYTHRDGAGGFVQLPALQVDPNSWDDGTGLVSVGTNKWTIQQTDWAGFGAVPVFTYGQAEYNSLASALDAIVTEAKELNPLLFVAARRGWLAVKQGATALNDIAQAQFVGIS